jgi:hypothetical protein
MRLLPAMPLFPLLLLALVGCNRPNYETPVKAYETFHREAQRGNYKEAWSALSKPTHEALQARAQTVAQASGGAVKADPVAFFFANVPPPADVTKVSLLSEDGEVAKVSVVSSTGESQVRMVRESSGWKVDLSESLQQP